MGIGASIFLIAAGAILAFGINAAVDVANLDVIGYILMAVGALGLLLTLVVFGNRRVDGANSTTVIRERDTLV